MVKRCIDRTGTDWFYVLNSRWLKERKVDMVSMALVGPMVVEQTRAAKRAFDISSRLLKDTLSFWARRSMTRLHPVFAQTSFP